MSLNVIAPLLTDTRLSLPQSSKIAVNMAGIGAGLKALNPHAVGMAGGTLMAAKNFIAPGSTTDEQGNEHQNSRLLGAAKGFGTGYVGGQLGARAVRRVAGALPPLPGAAPAAAGGAPMSRAVSTPAITPDVLPPGAAPGPGEAMARKVSALLPPLTGKIAMLPGGLDATANNAMHGPAATNNGSVTSTSKLADKVIHTGKADMSKGRDDAKAEQKEHEREVAIAKKEGSADGCLEPTMNKAMNAKPSEKDKKDAKPAFPKLNLKMK